jgi:hypothetical protein
MPSGPPLYGKTREGMSFGEFQGRHSLLVGSTLPQRLLDTVNWFCDSVIASHQDFHTYVC